MFTLACYGMGKQQKEINWSTFVTGEQFQSFCNKLLEFEFGEDLVPFGARGPDEGIDAQFTGQYKSKRGTFIFQTKFFDPSMDKNKARSSLITKLKGTKKQKGEFQKMASVRPDYYVVLTNVKITSKKRKKIEDIARNYDFEVILWDGEKLENLVAKHPLIYRWYFEEKLPLFLRYQDLFSNELTGRGILDHRIALHGRGIQKENFKEFLEGGEKILMISGRGGIGKTRILIEFAEIAEQQGWTQRFVRIETETFDEHLSELSPDKKYVLFLDDAHRYESFSKLLSFIKSEEPERMKLVLSTRPIFLNRFRNEMITGFKEMEIPTLSNKDIIQLLEELGISGEERDMICEKSNGFPLIAILTVQLKKEGVSSWNIPSQEIMQRFFNRYFDELRSAKSDQHIKLLRILAFLVPISTNDDRIHTKMTEVLKVSESEVPVMMQDLLEVKFVEMKADKMKIVPDLMGENLILQACFRDGIPTGFHEIIIKNFFEFAPKQIITNLALVESRADNKKLLDKLLEKLKKDALKGNNATKLMILTFLEVLSYLRPDDTFDILENMLETKREPFEHIDEFWGKITIDDSDIRREVAKHLKGVANSLDTFEEALEILKDLTLEEGNVQTYGESAKDILLGVCKIQYYRDVIIVGDRTYPNTDFREKVLEKTKSWSFNQESLDHIILKIIKEQLKETVRWSKKSLEKEWVITLCEIPIPEDKRFQKIRREFLDFLFEMGSHSPWESVRAKVPDLLYEIWGGAIRKGEKKDLTQEKRNRIKQEKELIFDFLIKRANEETNWHVIDSIIKTFKSLERWKEKGIQQKAEQVLDQFEKDERFQLYRVLIGHKGYEEEIEFQSFIKEKSKHFSEVFSEEQLAELLISILGETEAEFSYHVTNFLYELGVRKPEYALAIFKLLQKSDLRTKIYSGYILGGLRISRPQKTLSIIENLRLTKDTHTIVNSYELLTSYKDFDEKDLDLLEELLSEGDEILGAKICRVLPYVRYVNPERYLEILEDVSRNVTPKLAGIILRNINPVRFEFPEKEIRIYKSIITNFLPLENIFSYEFSLIMNEITKYDPLFLVEFFEKRIEHKETNEMENEKYVAIPFSFDEAVKNLVKEEKHLKDVLRRIRNWIEKGSLYTIKAPHVFWKICSTRTNQIRHEVVPIVKEVLWEWIEEGDHDKLQSVVHLLHYFPSTEWVFELFEKIIEKSKGERHILSSISAAIGTTQAEAISPGEPSPQSLHQITLLENMLKRSKNRHVKKFARNQIKSIKWHIKWMAEIVEEKW